MIRPRWTPQGDDAARESGINTLEVVLMTPVIVFALLLMVGAGLVVNAKGDLGSASSDAARMGSLQRSVGAANSQAAATADDDLQGAITCTDNKNGTPDVEPSGFAAGGLFTVTVVCHVSYLGMTVALSSTSVSPVDPYREAN